MTFIDYIFALSPMLVLGFIFWLISLAKKDVSIVDSLWSLFFITAGFFIYLQLDTASVRSQIVILLVVVWAIRLSAYITIRNWGHEEDRRYQYIRQNNEPGFKYKSLYIIFGFQALIAWVVAIPLFYAIDSSTVLGVIDLIGLALWLVGMFFETTADYQLWRFKRNPNNKGKILTHGLWSYTRHPNYFGESLIWWGYFCFALSAGAWFSILSPLLMTFLLLKFSGVHLLEQTMKQRPGYEDYMQNTNAFLPGFKQGRTQS